MCCLKLSIVLVNQTTKILRLFLLLALFCKLLFIPLVFSDFPTRAPLEKYLQVHYCTKINQSRKQKWTDISLCSCCLVVIFQLSESLKTRSKVTSYVEHICTITTHTHVFVVILDVSKFWINST